MEFRWNEWKIEHIPVHGVDPDEAEAVISEATSPYPRYRGDGKWLVWGRGRGGRLLQVVFILDRAGAAYVIHARPLTETKSALFGDENHEA